MRCLITPTLLCAVLILGAGACGDSALAPTDTMHSTVGRGTLVSAPGEDVTDAFVWSADGTALYYEVRNRFDGTHHVSRASLGGGAPTVLDLGGAVEWIAPNLPTPLAFLAEAPNGDVYLTAQRSATDGTRGILRLQNGNDTSWVQIFDDAEGLALAGDGRHLVYGWRPPTLNGLVNVVGVDLATWSVHGIAGGVPLALSADGTELLCAPFADASDRYFAADVATGTTRDLDLGLHVPAAVFRWPTRGVFALYDGLDPRTGSTDFFLRDVSADTTTLLYHDAPGGSSAAVKALSADASKAALVLSGCAQSDCGSTHNALYVIRVPGGTTMWVAGVDDAFIAHPTFAPDGHHIAYLIGHDLYVSPVP